MYVKVTGDGKHGDSLWETSGPIESGRYGLPFTDEDGEGPVFDFEKGLPFVPQLLAIREVDLDGQTTYEKNHSLISVRFAWWFDKMEGTIGVVTTRNIFIMSQEGHTIDKV